MCIEKQTSQASAIKSPPVKERVTPRHDNISLPEYLWSVFSNGYLDAESETTLTLTQLGFSDKGITLFAASGDLAVSVVSPIRTRPDA